MTKQQENRLHPDNKVTSFVLGFILGLLFALGLFLCLKSHLVKHVETTVVKQVVVDRVVTRVVVHNVNVPVTNTVTEKRLFKAQLLNADSTVQKEWIVTKCKFRVIGATLTDVNGNVIPVQGNVRILPLDKNNVGASSEAVLF